MNPLTTEQAVNFTSFATKEFPTNFKVMEYLHGNYDGDKFKREVSKRAKQWIKNHGFDTILIKCVRGVFHVTNANNYLLTAKDILESATSIEFESMGDNMARIKRPSKIESGQIEIIHTQTNTTPMQIINVIETINGVISQIQSFTIVGGNEEEKQLVMVEVEPIEVGDTLEDTRFVNGFDSWIETHFEICEAITTAMNNNENDKNTAQIRHIEQGRNGLCLLSKELATKFENSHANTDWGESEVSFHDSIDSFIQTEIFNSK